MVFSLTKWGIGEFAAVLVFFFQTVSIAYGFCVPLFFFVIYNFCHVPTDPTKQSM